jgi:hypothetical protein
MVVIYVLILYVIALLLNALGPTIFVFPYCST